MIIRRLASSTQFITQPQHAALSSRIMREWHPDVFPDSPRKGSILHAIDQHDNGWESFDRTLILDESTGQLLDFMEVSDDVKRETSWIGIDPLAGDPYAAALGAQHRVHVYRRFAEDPAWRPFFDKVTAARDSYLRAAAGVSGSGVSGSLDELLRDYTLVRAGDLASLAFCNNWADVPADDCGYGMQLEGTTLRISPDPLGGRTIEIAIEARELPPQVRFASLDEARQALAAAPVVTLRGQVGGGSR